MDDFMAVVGDEYAIEIEDALRCKLFVDHEASVISVLDMMEQIVASKQVRARRMLILGDIRTDVLREEAARGFTPDTECREIISAIRRYSKSFKKVVCVGPALHEIGREAQRAGISTAFVTNEDELTAELKTAVRDKFTIGVAYHSDFLLPLVIDGIFGTAFLSTSTYALDKVALPCTTDIGVVTMVSRQGATLLNGKACCTGQLRLTRAAHGMGFVALGKFALREAAVTSVVLNQPIRAIARGAFFRCSELHEVELPSTLDFIGRSAFAQCESLESITIPSGCRSISRYAFKDCERLAFASLPGSISSIGFRAFSGCSSELVLEVEKGSYAETWVADHGYASRVIDGAAADESKKILPESFTQQNLLFSVHANNKLEVIGLAQSRKSHQITSLDIPSKVEDCQVVGIGAQAFVNNQRLTTVRIAEGVNWIAPEAFAGCASLTDISLPESLKIVGNRAFAGCACFIADENFTFSVTKDEGAIEHYHGQQATVMVPEKVLGRPVVKISSGAFKGNNFLHSVTLPEGLREIQDGAFALCSNLENVKIPALVTEIGRAAFDPLTPLIVQRDSYSNIWAAVNKSPIEFNSPAINAHGEPAIIPVEKDDVLFRQLPPFIHEALTIEKLCQLIGTEVPPELLDRKELILPDANAYWTIARRYEAYFDLLNETEAIEGALVKQPSLMILGEPFAGDTGEVPVIIHPDPVGAFRDVCRWRLSRFTHLRIVGIGGSQGKTSMKNFVAQVLESTYSTLKSAGNTNTFNALDHALRRLRPDHCFYVQEVGAGGHYGRHIKYAAAALRPDYVILTNIRDNHLETFGTRENLLDHKTSLVRELRDDGVAFLNADDEALWNYKSDKKIIYYGIDNKQADYRAENIVMHDDSVTFTIVNRNRRILARISVLGKHNVYNALAAFALGEAAGVDKAENIRQLRRFRASGMRQNYSNIAGYWMYVDCYNSSPDSVRQCLDTIVDISLPEDCRRIVILGDILELGEEEIAKHESLGDMLIEHKDHIDKVFCFGPLSGYTAERARQGGLDVFQTEDREELHAMLLEQIREGDLILWKASHGVRLFLSIDELVGTSFDINDQTTVNIYGQRLETEEMRFTLMPEGAQIDAWLSSSPTACLPSSLEGVPLIALGKNSFVGASDLESIEIPSTVNNIGFGAFFKSSNLREIRLSEGLKLIDRSAFNGCASLQEVIIPATCLHIGDRAFFDCVSLQGIIIPKSVAMIGERAFGGCLDLVITCERGSFAEEYAIRNSLKYSLTEEILEADQPC